VIDTSGFLSELHAIRSFGAQGTGVISARSRCVRLAGRTDGRGGVLGVIAALEIARASRAAGGPAISVVSFQDENG